MTRLIFPLVLLLCFGEARAAPAKIQPGTIEMVIERNGSKIGSHIIAVRRLRGTAIVTVHVEVHIKFAFMTVYTYRMDSREIWSKGRLIAYDAHIDDDGKKLHVKAHSTPAGLVVQSEKGKLVAPLGSMFTGYWNIETVKKTRLIDGEENKFLDITVTSGGEKDITVGGHLYRTRLFHLRGDMERDVWYDEFDRVVKIRAVVRDGSEVVTRRR